MKDKAGVKKVVDAEKVAGTGIFQVDLKSRIDKLSIFVVDVSLLERADNFPATTLLLSIMLKWTGLSASYGPRFVRKSNTVVIEILLRDDLIRVFECTLWPTHHRCCLIEM